MVEIIKRVELFTVVEEGLTSPVFESSVREKGCKVLISTGIRDRLPALITYTS